MGKCELSHEAVNQLLSDRATLMSVADELALALKEALGPNTIDIAQIKYADLADEFRRREAMA